MINWVKRLKKDESGAAMVVVVLSMVMILGFASLAVDLGNAYNNKVEMQNACDLSALAAAALLPDENATKLKAREYAELNGYAPEDVCVNILEGGDKVEVTIAQDVKTYFAGVIGFEKVPVSCKAVAAVTTTAGGNDYAIFSGNTSDFSGSGYVTVSGGVHANSSAGINNSGCEWIVDTFEARGDAGVSSALVTGALKTDDGGYIVGDECQYIDMPDYRDIIESRLPGGTKAGSSFNNGSAVSWTEYAASHTVGGTVVIPSGETVYISGEPGTIAGNVEINGTIRFAGYVEFSGGVVLNGNIVGDRDIQFISGSHLQLNANGTIVADGRITINGVATTPVRPDTDGAKYPVVYSRGKSGSPGIFLGDNGEVNISALLYAPDGYDIQFGKGNYVIKGAMIGERIGSDNGTMNITLPKNDSHWEFGGAGGSGGRGRTAAKLVE